MKYILLHSKVYFVVISVFIISTMIIERLLTPSVSEIESIHLFLNFSVYKLKSISLFFIISVFSGVYLAGGLVNLKKNYLWKNSKKYKNSILNGYFIITFVVSMIVVTGLYPILANDKLILLLPLCMSVFASQMVLGKNILFKILVTPVPFVIAQLYRFNIGLDVIIFLIVIATVILIYTMYKNTFYTFGLYVNVDEKKSSSNTVALMTTGLNASHLNSINYHIGLIVVKWITKSKRLIDWAILMPHTRLTIITLFYVVFMFSAMLFLNEKVRPLLQFFAVMLLSMIIIGILIESSNLFRQTKTIAHVFVGSQHRQLKNKILLALDKNIMFNILIFVIGILLVIKILSITIIFKTLILSFLAISIFSLSVYPYLLCLNWVNLSTMLIVSMFIYALLIYTIIKWIYTNTEQAMTAPYIVGFIIVCLVLRGITQFTFWHRSLEALLKNK